MCRRIRILFLIDYFHSTGGTERHLSLLVRNLCRESFEVTVVAFDLGENPLIDEMRQAGAEVIHLPLARVYTPHAMAQAWRLLRLIRTRRIEIVQTFHQKADTFGAIVTRIAGVRHIVSSRRDTGELKSRRYVLVSRRIRSWFEKVIVVADRVGNAVVQREGIDRADIVRIYNGVDADAFQPPTPAEATSARQALGFSAEDFVVGMVANFRPEKSHAVLFAAAREALPQIPRLKLLLVGSGPLFAHYSAQRGQLAGRPDAVFVGAVPDVQRQLHAMDVACLIPGANEGFSNAVLEKMATGLPLVVSDIGGNAEAVIDGRNGFVIPPNDVAALTEALVALHADPLRRREMGHESRRLVEERFSLEQMWRTHADLYRSLNDGSAPPAALAGAATC
ncbi:MAG: glycosyltransferase [Sterolibacteriaceae bacterium]|nr:glycosyltransferase [Sterolibacteriaceae bacterium]MBK9085335.1 glycosyltransferase [Sterolibacteriaceae bacterium]